MPTLVSTGQLTITDVNDGLHARLSSEQHAVPTGSEGEAGDYAGCETTMTVLMGTQDDSASWSFSAVPTAGITGSLVGSTYVVTNMTTDAGYVDITASRVGFPDLTSRFSISKAKRGWAGPAITLVVSSSGFTFIDNVAEPAVQSIALTVARHGTNEPVTFYATNGVELGTDNGQLELCNYSLGTYGCGQGDTAYLDLAQFGDNQQVTITAVCGELTATKTLVRLAGSTAAAGATVGAIWGQNVVNQPSFTDFLDTFEGDASLWQNYSGAGEVSVVSITDGQSGGKALRIGNSSGNDMAWLIHKQNIAFDPNATYRMKFRARSLGGSGKAYFGIAGVAADGTSLVNITGGNSNSNQHYIAAADVSLPGTWTEYVGFVKGVAATGIGSPRTVVTNPAQLHQATKYIRPMVLVNYNGVVGQAEIDYVRIELLTDSVNWDTVTGAGKDTLITTANNASTAATTANNLLADIASDNKLTPSEKNNVKREWDGLVAEKAGINTQASAFSITTENTAYNTSYDALNTYLSTLLASMTTTSDITGSTLRTNFSNLYSARQALLNKIAEVASTRSNWTSVNGKPTDEQIMNVLVSQGVYNGIEFPYSGRSLYVPCYVDNNQGASAWYKLAEAKLASPYNGFSFVGSVTWGQSSKRFNARADIKISFSASSPATTFQDQVYKFAGDDPTGVLKVRLSQDGNGLWTIGIYTYLTGFKGLMLDGNWYTSTAAGSWVDDYQTSTTQLAGDPGLTNFAPSANYELGATRNVHRGDWANSTTYALGDTVLSGGYGWSCILAHTSVSGTNSPPAYPTTANTWWTLAAVKGEDAKTAMLTASSFVVKVAQDGTLSPASIALTAVGQNLAGSPTFTVTSGTATLTGTGEARVLAASGLTTDQATIKIAWDGREDYVTITKVREGVSGITVVAGNEAHTLPASPSGAVSSYTGSGTTIQVFEGATALVASSSAVVSAFRIGTITQTPAASITIGAVTYAGSTATIAAHSAMLDGTDSVTLAIPVTVYRTDGTSSTFTKTQTITKAKAGAVGATGVAGLTVVMANEAHTLAADSAGVVASYTNSGTTIQVYEGTTLLTAGGSSNGSFTVGTAVQAPAATVTAGAVSYAGTTATIAAHSGMANGTDSMTLTFPITVKRADGTSVVVNKAQTLTKSKGGVTGAQGPSVTITTSRAASFTSTDGALDGSQTDITFTAITSGIASPTYVWSFSGLQTNPTASTTSTQVITAAQFGTAKSATVKCTVSGNNNYVDIVTIIRVEKSTAEAGATVGADGSNLSVGIGSNLLPNSDLALSIGQWNVGWISNGVGDASVSRDLAAPDWCPIGGHTAGITRPSTPTGSWDMLNDVKIPVTPGSRYEMSGRLASHRCTTALLAVFYTAADVHCGEFATTPTMVNGGQVLSNFAQHVQFVTAPATAAYAKFVVRSYANGGANPYSWLTQPMFCLANAGQTVASPWSPSNFNEKITAGNIGALIESAAIGSAYIGNAAIGTAHIQDLSVDTLQVKDGAISNTNYGSAPANLYLYNTAIAAIAFIGPAFTGTGKTVHLHYSFGISNVATTAKNFYIKLYRDGVLIESTLVKLMASQDSIVSRSIVDPTPTSGATYQIDILPAQDANGNVWFYNRFIFGTVLKK